MPRVLPKPLLALLFALTSCTSHPEPPATPQPAAVPRYSATTSRSAAAPSSAALVAQQKKVRSLESQLSQQDAVVASLDRQLDTRADAPASNPLDTEISNQNSLLDSLQAEKRERELALTQEAESANASRENQGIDLSILAAQLNEERASKKKEVESLDYKRRQLAALGYETDELDAVTGRLDEAKQQYQATEDQWLQTQAEAREAATPSDPTAIASREDQRKQLEKDYDQAYATELQRYQNLLKQRDLENRQQAGQTDDLDLRFRTERERQDDLRSALTRERNLLHSLNSQEKPHG